MPLVTSSAIHSAEWKQGIGSNEDDPDPMGSLTLVFKKGVKRTFTLYEVPRSVYEAFLAAPSKGRFFQDQLRGQYG